MFGSVTALIITFFWVYFLEVVKSVQKNGSPASLTCFAGQAGLQASGAAFGYLASPWLRQINARQVGLQLAFQPQPSGFV